MDAFLAIEKILQFHHTSSRQPLRVSQVRLRAFQNGTTVSPSDINMICSIYPEAYRVWSLRGNLVMDAPSLPHDAQLRKTVFSERWSNKENLVVNSDGPCTSKALSKPVNTPSKGTILMGRLASTPRNPKLSLLERIRQKEAVLKAARTPEALQMSKDAFLRSQVPKLKRVLAELATRRHSQSLTLEHIMDVLRTNVSKLGDGELKRALQLLVQLHPTFCSIVMVGDVTHVKLNNSANEVRTIG